MYVLCMYVCRFSGSFSRDYPGIGIHGFNVWEKNKHCVTVNEKTKQVESGAYIHTCIYKYIQAFTSYIWTVSWIVYHILYISI